MARKLVFNDPAMFTLFMDSFLNTPLGMRNFRSAARILDLVDKISRPALTTADVKDEKGELTKLRLLQERVLNDAGGMIVVEDADYDYVKQCFEAVNWQNWAAQSAVQLEEWLKSAPKAELA